MKEKQPYTSPQTVVIEKVSDYLLSNSTEKLQFDNHTPTTEALGRQGGGWDDDEDDN